MFPFRLHIFRLNPNSVSLRSWGVFHLPARQPGSLQVPPLKATVRHPGWCGRVIPHCMGSAPPLPTLEYLSAPQQRDAVDLCSLCNPPSPSQTFFWQSCCSRAQAVFAQLIVPVYFTRISTEPHPFFQAFSPTCQRCFELSFCPPLCPQLPPALPCL